jgi:hypothetical protein
MRTISDTGHLLARSPVARGFAWSGSLTRSAPPWRPGGPACASRARGGCLREQTVPATNGRRLFATSCTCIAIFARWLTLVHSSRRPVWLRSRATSHRYQLAGPSRYEETLRIIGRRVAAPSARARRHSTRSLLGRTSTRARITCRAAASRPPAAASPEPPMRGAHGSARRTRPTGGAAVFARRDPAYLGARGRVPPGRAPGLPGGARGRQADPAYLRTSR